MSVPEAAFVLVHGGWHNRSAWDEVTPILEANGFAALTLDLPGAGANTIAPLSLGRVPFDPASIGGRTTTHTLDSSHSPFLSQPANLSGILMDIHVQSLTEQGAQL